MKQGIKQSNLSLAENSKSKKKVRKITFLQVDTIPKPIHVTKFISFFSDLIESHPELTFGSKKPAKKDGNDSKEEVALKEKTEKSSKVGALKAELVFGLKEVLRRVKKNELFGVIVADPLTVHIQSTLRDLCIEFNVPFLVSKDLQSIGDILKISTLSCLAFTHQVREPTSLCHAFYQTFLEFVQTLPEEDLKNPCLASPPSKPAPVISNPEKAFDIIDLFRNLPDEANFYIPRNDESVNIDMDAAIEKPRRMADFIKLDDAYSYEFPVRSYFLDIDLQLPWAAEPEKPILITTPNLGKQLFAVPGPDQTNLNLKGLYKEPKTIQLQSSGRAKFKRSKFKKIQPKGRKR